MIHRNVNEVFKQLRLEFFLAKYAEDDIVIEEYIREHLDPDEAMFLEPHAISSIFREYFSYEVDSSEDTIYFPDSLYNDFSDGDTYVSDVFHIPDLLPYLDDPECKKIIKNIEIDCTYGHGSNSHYELTYVPSYEFYLAHCDEEEIGIRKRFNQQPATFIIAISDDGSPNAQSTVEFLVDIKDSALKLDAYITRKKEEELMKEQDHDTKESA